MSIPSVSRFGVSVILLCAGPLTVPAVAAASQCKALPQAGCAAAADCVWVESYRRKDGRSVAGHCKARPGKKAKPQAAAGTLRLGKSD